MTVISSRHIKKSRKEHRCCFCNNMIKIGSPYLDDWVREHKLQVHMKRHEECQKLYDEFKNEIPYFRHTWVTSDAFCNRVLNLYINKTCPMCENYKKCNFNNFFFETGSPCSLRWWQINKMVRLLLLNREKEKILAEE